MGNLPDAADGRLDVDKANKMTVGRMTEIYAKHTYTHNRFTAGLEYVRVHPG